MISEVSTLRYPTSYDWNFFTPYFFDFFKAMIMFLNRNLIQFVLLVLAIVCDVRTVSSFSSSASYTRGIKPDHHELLHHSISRRDNLLGLLGVVTVGLGSTLPVKADDDGEDYKVLLNVQLDPRDPSKTGEVEIEIFSTWAPLAAKRFRELVELGFYDDARFFRVLPGYVAQFGIASDPVLNKEWIFCEKNCKALPDEVRTQKNSKGTLSFASKGKNTRQTQVFINLSNNDGPPNFLDSQGFVPFGRVTKGMDTVVSKLNSEYGLKETLSGGLTGSVSQGKAAYFGVEYLNALFPNLSYIKAAKII